jgi:hypothetical protein
MLSSVMPRSEGCQVSERVADRDIRPAVTVTQGMIIPDETRWTVVLDSRGQPAAAISPGGTSVAENPVVADAALPVAFLLQSEALARATAGTVVVVTTESAVTGVWAGTDLVDALMHGARREASWAFAGDVLLPGVVTKKNVTRRCQHTEQGISCVTVLVVPEKPEVMPQCPARDRIGAHVFGW